MAEPKRMAILGGGPIGLECLLKAVSSGWDGVLFERGRVGEHVRQWGHVCMFSPMGMNVSEAGQAAARRAGGPALDPGRLPSGNVFAERYLDPLAASPPLADRVHTRTTVLAVSRDSLRKGEEIATPARGRRPFRILVRGDNGERVETADIVIDATGTFGSWNWLGAGGIPAIGERDAAARIGHHLPDIGGIDRTRFAGRHTLVVGAGHSAATAIGALGDLATEAGETRVTWVTRTPDARPVPDVEGDPLPERQRVTELANDAALASPGWLDREAGTRIASLHPDGERFQVEIVNGGRSRRMTADNILALVGYRPDLGLARELQVQTCWATEGTYPLAAALLAGSGHGGDCLTAGSDQDAGMLIHPEAGFFTLGTKSYGRNPNFLIQTGRRQIEGLFDLLAGRNGA